VSQMTKTTKGPLSDSVTTKTQHVVKQEVQWRWGSGAGRYQEEGTNWLQEYTVCA
jgi:hypothetical protein